MVSISLFPFLFLTIYRRNLKEMKLKLDKVKPVEVEIMLKLTKLEKQSEVCEGMEKCGV